MNDDIYWALCLQVPGIGPKNFFKLLDVLGHHQLTISDFWQSSSEKLYQLQLPSLLIERLVTFRAGQDPFILSEKLQHDDIQLVTVNNGLYPRLLKEIPTPPPLLYCKGDMSKINSKPIAIVGTRNVTSYGKYATQLLTKELVKCGYSIISGFMYGVDSIAHQTALQYHGYTVGVLGFGFDYMYPQRRDHEELAKKILVEGGSLVTEYPPHVTPHPGHFPARNRIVAGLSLGVVVTEAAKESGSKITAQYAGEYGREVFSVSGAINSKYCEGVKDLVNSGAKLVMGVEDIIEEFETIQRLGNRDRISTVLENIENVYDKKIVELLWNTSMEVEELLQELQIPITELNSRLSMLEIQGVVESESGKYRTKI